MGGKDGIKDPRFVIEHAGDPEYSLVTRSSDGQMLFLANMLEDEARHPARQPHRRGAQRLSLFTGDAGQGESNIRRWIIENDWLEAIVALPLNMFYNTGIATYVWVLTNRKPEHRRGKVQLIDATQWFKPLRKNLGKKNCELSEADIQRICDVPRLRGDRAVEDLPQRALRLLEGDGRAAAAPPRHRARTRLHAEGDQGAEGDGRARRGRAAGDQGRSTRRHRPTRSAACSRRRSTARPASSSTSPTPTCATPSRCRCSRRAASRRSSSARCCRTRPDAWYDPASIKIGYEISFTRDFYKPQPLRTLEEIRADILALERETEGC